MKIKSPLKHRKAERGQSTIEFALTLLLMMSILWFFVQASFFFAYGNIVHYATYMAARAYLSAGVDRSDQVTRAQTVIKKMLKKSGQTRTEKYQFVATGVDGDGDIAGLFIEPPGEFNPGRRDLSWLQGVRYRFRANLPMVPMGGGKNSVNKVTLTSESWLSRERTADEVQRWIREHGGQGIVDNGY